MKCPFYIKVCSVCKRLLVASESNFYKKKDGKYGLTSRCKECQIEKSKDRQRECKEEISKYKKQYVEKNKDKIKEYKSKYYQNKKKKELKNNPFNNIDPNKIWNHCPFVIRVCTECKKILVANEMNFYKDKTGKYEISARCKECGKKYGMQYRNENPNKILDNRNKRKEREENGIGFIDNSWYEMMQFFNWSCAYSGEKLNKNNRSIDHIIPLAKGGLHNPWNCVPMVKNYNISKNDSIDMGVWYKEQSYFSEERLNKIYEWIEYAKNKWDSNTNKNDK